MKIEGIVRRHNEKIDRPKIYDLKIEAVLNPVNSYLVGFYENLTTNDEKKEKYSQFEYRNIISIIYGTICESGLSFDIQIVVYADGHGFTNQIISAECLENGNYVFDYENYDCIGGEKYIFNMNDISTLPVFKNKTVTECIQHFMEIKNLCDYCLLFHFHKVASKDKLMDINEFGEYTNEQF